MICFVDEKLMTLNFKQFRVYAPYFPFLENELRLPLSEFFHHV